MIIHKIKNGDFGRFLTQVKNKSLFVFGDINTFFKATKLLDALKKNNIHYSEKVIMEAELIPTVDLANDLISQAKNSSYVLAIGSGSINDLGKYVATKLNLNYAIFATAPSMDGYLSKGSALINNGEKITFEVNPPTEMLIDIEVVKNAPEIMIAAGIGDILGKYTALADWQFAHILNSEEIHKEAFKMMNEALTQVIKSFDLIKVKDDLGISLLMDALNTAGIAMKICGNSRPASGSEHHISHYLEMNFIKNNLPIPLHGLKVGLGTLIAIELYRSLDLSWFEKEKHQSITKIISELPESEEIAELLKVFNAPTRFSEIDVDKPLLIDTLRSAYKIRDRFTILTYYNQNNKIDLVIDKLISKFL